MKIKEIEISDQECIDIMTNAIDTGALNYWAEITHCTRNRKGYITLFSIDDDEGKHHLVSPEVIRRGATRILTDMIVIFNEERRLEILQNLLSDAIDADGDDAIIQAGIYNDIIYG